MRKAIITVIVSFFILFVLYAFLSTSFFWDLREPHSLKYDDKSFSKIATDIINQNEIFEMDDCSRYSKTLNHMSIEMTSDNSNDDSFYHPIFYKKALDSLHITLANFENLKAQLSSTGLYSFYRSGDSILFVVDGFLDASWGYLYVAGGIKDTSGSSVLNHDYNLVDSVNTKWRKVGIY
jgi:hypothetical protein